MDDTRTNNIEKAPSGFASADITSLYEGLRSLPAQNSDGKQLGLPSLSVGDSNAQVGSNPASQSTDRNQGALNSGSLLNGNDALSDTAHPAPPNHSLKSLKGELDDRKDNEAASTGKPAASEGDASNPSKNPLDGPSCTVAEPYGIGLGQRSRDYQLPPLLKRWKAS